MSVSPETSRAWPIVSLVILLMLGAINLCLLLFVVPDFDQRFQTTWPGKPLPNITQFIIATRIPLVLIALAWSIAGTVTVWRRHWTAICIVSLGQLFLFALIWVTTVALIIAEIPIISLASPASSH
jgi:hypothetical protein